ncbi:hypothetical protein L1887_18319 [Cichorium endivia]|nr:hypothetical protein L1887_18319 [Cichorium endivia]
MGVAVFVRAHKEIHALGWAVEIVGPKFESIDWSWSKEKTVPRLPKEEAQSYCSSVYHRSPRYYSLRCYRCRPTVVVGRNCSGGQFFPDSSEHLEELTEYMEGRKNISLLTYFSGAGAAKVLSAAAKGSGNQGFNGLYVAYLSGKQSPSGLIYETYSQDDIDALRALAEEPEIIDIFLTYPSYLFHELLQFVLNHVEDRNVETLLEVGAKSRSIAYLK